MLAADAELVDVGFLPVNSNLTTVSYTVLICCFKVVPSTYNVSVPLDIAVSLMILHIT